MENIFINPGKEQWAELTKRPAFDYAALEAIVQPVLKDVKENGDEAVKKYAAKFDQVQLQDLFVTAAEMEEAIGMVKEELKLAIQLA